MPTLAETLANASELHRRGELTAAEAIYRHVLVVEPQQSDAVRLLGLALLQQNRLAEAQSYLQQWVQQSPQNAEAYFYFGFVQHQLCALAEAERSYRRAISLQPQFEDALNNLGNLLSDAQQFPEAEVCYRRVLELNPARADALINLGILCTDTARYEEAVALLTMARNSQPQSPEVHYNLGVAYQASQRMEDASRCFEQAVLLRPDYAKAWNNWGVLCLTRMEFPQAIACLESAVKFMPTDAEYHYNLGIALKEAGELTRAVQSFEQSLRLKPNNPAALNHLGTTWHSVPDYAQAQACYLRTLELDPLHADAHSNYSNLLLLQGDFAQGWDEYEWRWKSKSLQAQAPQYARPQWQGESLADKTLLVVAEQGMGDTLQFLRYLPLLKPKKLVFAVQRHLQPLLRNFAAVDEWIAQGETPAEFDVYIPLLSIPRILQTRLETIPNTVPYLEADPRLIDVWRARLAPLRGFRIGINWRGRPGIGPWRLRDLPLTLFQQLAECAGVRLISLQHGPLMADETEIAKRIQLITVPDLDREHGPYTDTAAIMKNCDLLISSDTSVAHLAGALGVPVWLALPRVADWRWLLDRADSPWYPTMRLFRQRVRGDWNEVMQQIKHALEEQRN
jgi:tetratricopeptide (TPR) repeat protein